MPRESGSKSIMYDERWDPSPSATGLRRDRGALSEGFEDEFTRPLGELLRPIRHWYWVIVLTILVCSGAVAGFSMMQTPVYQASIKIVVGQEGKMFADPSQAVYLQQLAPTLSEAITTRPVMESVVQEMNLKTSPEALINATTAEPVADSQFIDVSYKDTDAARA